MNQIAKYFQQQQQQKLSFHLSFIDRWPINSGLINSFTELINNELKQFPVNSSNEIILLFTAHSLPLNVSFTDTHTHTYTKINETEKFRY